MPVGGGNVIYTQSGADEIHLLRGGELDRLVNGGGPSTIALPSGVDYSTISFISSSSGDNLSLLVANRPELAIENALVPGSDFTIRSAGQVIPLSTFPNFNSTLAEYASIHIDYFGAYSGGFIGSAAISDGRGTQLFYRLGEVVGAYASEFWIVDVDTGSLSGQFNKPDMGGSEFTSVTVVAGDGVTDTFIFVTVRWAYSNEFEPTL